MKNVIRVALLAALTVSVSLSKTTPRDQPPPECLPCTVQAAPQDQPPPECLPCTVQAAPQDQPPPECLPCTVN
ncbi:MAG TPA: hypothetical protein VKR43_14890 [Bryobacteraceae bacterium]|nr:hypothetical protein [Bryobacteraceae bacterium]